MLSEIVKTVATSYQILRLTCTKSDFGWGSAPDPAGLLTALRRRLSSAMAGFKGPTSNEMGRRDRGDGRKGRGRKRGTGRGRDGRGGKGKGREEEWRGWKREKGWEEKEKRREKRGLEEVHNMRKMTRHQTAGYGPVYTFMKFRINVTSQNQKTVM